MSKYHTDDPRTDAEIAAAYEDLKKATPDNWMEVAAQALNRSYKAREILSKKRYMAKRDELGLPPLQPNPLRNHPPVPTTKPPISS